MAVGAAMRHPRQSVSQSRPPSLVGRLIGRPKCRGARARSPLFLLDEMMRWGWRRCGGGGGGCKPQPASPTPLSRVFVQRSGGIPLISEADDEGRNCHAPCENSNP